MMDELGSFSEKEVNGVPPVPLLTVEKLRRYDQNTKDLLTGAGIGTKSGGCLLVRAERTCTPKYRICC